MKSRSDDLIYGTRPTGTGPLGIEATFESWAASAVVLVTVWSGAFWAIYGTGLLAGIPPIVNGVGSLIASILIAVPAAITAGVVVGRHVGPRTPFLTLFTEPLAEFRAPSRPDDGQEDVRPGTRYRYQQQPAALSAPRRVAIRYPDHFDKEQTCVRPECLPTVDRGDGGVPQSRPVRVPRRPRIRRARRA